MAIKSLLITYLPRSLIRGERDEVTGAVGRGLRTIFLWYVCDCHKLEEM